MKYFTKNVNDEFNKECDRWIDLVKTNKALSEAVINNKAYENENNALKDKAIQFEYTVEQLYDELNEMTG